MYLSHINASLPLFLSPFPSLKINEIFKINKLAANPVRESQQMLSPGETKAQKGQSGIQYLA